MSNRTYICTECRTSRRAEAAGGLETPLKCPSCQGALCEVSPKVEIPRKSNGKAWSKLKEWVHDANQARGERTRAYLRRNASEQLVKIDWQLGVIEGQPPSASRDASLKRLREERAKVERDVG